MSCWDESSGFSSLSCVIREPHSFVLRRDSRELRRRCTASSTTMRMLFLRPRSSKEISGLSSRMGESRSWLGKNFSRLEEIVSIEGRSPHICAHEGRAASSVASVAGSGVTSGAAPRVLGLHGGSEWL